MSLKMENNSKSFGLTTISVNNRKTVFLISFIILIAGFLAYNSMPKENFPELKIPEIYVGIAKPGSSPEYMAKKNYTIGRERNWRNQVN